MLTPRSGAVYLAFTFLAGALWLRPSTLGAAELNIDLDPAKTQINFAVSDTLHTAHGTFRIKGGHVTFDPATQAVRGEIIVEANSGSSGNRLRDRRMTADILDAPRYPEIRFTPAQVTGSVSPSAASNIFVAGWFRIHGQAHWIIIPMQIRIGGDAVTATGRFSVPFVAWGMKNPSNLLIKVNQEVQIEVTASGRIAARSSPR